MKKFFIAFTLAEEICQFAHSVRKFGRVEDAQYNYRAFTLAEVLITLAIIGIVSALVIPSVLKNYNDKKYNTARLKALKTFGEAGKLASINGEINGQPSARAFVENVLSKYLKITKVCDNDKASECNFPEKIQPSNPADRKINMNDAKKLGCFGYNGTKGGTNKTSTDFSIYVTTADGFSAKIFYNPNCMDKTYNIRTYAYCRSDCPWYPYWTLDAVCLNIVYDMNGIKAPNHAGEDVGFVTLFWSDLKTVAVAPGIIPYSEAYAVYEEGGKTNSDAEAACAHYGTTKKQYTLANVYELSSAIAINRSFTSMPYTQNWWSGSLVPSGSGNMFYVWDGGITQYASANSSYKVYCVRR